MLIKSPSGLMSSPLSTAYRMLDMMRAAGPGLAFCVIIAAAASFLSQNHGGPVVLYALLLGFPFHFLTGEPRLAAGIAVASGGALRMGVALLGARITIEQIMRVGLPITVLIVVLIAATIAFGWLAARLLGLPGRFGVLSAGATAICGASAAVAISAVLPSHANRERDTAFTIVGVTTLSTFAMIAYPVLAKSIGLSGVDTGIFFGATIHDVAQVVGAGYSVSVEAGDKATIVKLLRVALLLPVVLIIAVVSRRVWSGTADTPRGMMPWFLAAFAALVAANSLGLVPSNVSAALSEISRWCIVVAIAALGVKTALCGFFDVGRTAIVLMLAETFFLLALFLALLHLIR